MTKSSADPSAAEYLPERVFAEEFGVVGERIGMPRGVARLLGWMLICDPPRQSTADLTAALGVSRASISIASRLLEASHLIKRVPQPGRRGHVFELDAQIFAGQMDAANPFRMLREVMERGIDVIGTDTDPRAARLREARDFYAFVEQEVPRTIERYRVQRQRQEVRSE